MTTLAAGRGGLRVEAVLGWAAAAATVLLAYVVVVLGGALIVGRTDSPPLGLSIIATALVAIVAEPVRRRVQSLSARRLNPSQRSPYEVLSDFSEEVASAGPVSEVPAVIARMLAHGLGVEWAQVWLLVEGGPQLAATYPPDAPAEVPPPTAYETRPLDGLRDVTVAHAERPLAVVRVKEREDRRLTRVEERLLSGLAAQAGMILETAQLNAQLEEKLRELSAREAALRRAREALVTTQDLERRDLERDIHDGAQQQLVALAINLRLAKALAPMDPPQARHVLEEQLEAAAAAIRTLSDLSTGVAPDALRYGLGPALAAATDANPVPVRVDVDATRLPAAVEATLFFCALEAIQNATKHAGASGIDVRLRREGGRLALLIMDDGRGIRDDAVDGSGLVNMRERVASIGAELRVGPGRPRGTGVTVLLPVDQHGVTGEH